MIDRSLTPAEHLGLIRDMGSALEAATALLRPGAAPAGSLLLGAALERHLQIAGEAARLCDPEFAAGHPDLPWQQLIDTRNKLMHRDRLLPPAESRALATALGSAAEAPLAAAEAELAQAGVRRPHTVARGERGKGRGSAGAGSGGGGAGFSPAATLAALRETLTWMHALGDRERREILRDPVLLPAAMRGLQLVGEASRHLDAELVARTTDLPWQKLVDWRDRLAHDYAAVDEGAALRFVEVELPRLETRLARLAPGMGAERRPRRDMPVAGGGGGRRRPR